MQACLEIIYSQLIHLITEENKRHSQSITFRKKKQTKLCFPLTAAAAATCQCSQIFRSGSNRRHGNTRRQGRTYVGWQDAVPHIPRKSSG